MQGKNRHLLNFFKFFCNFFGFQPSFIGAYVAFTGAKAEKNILSGLMLVVYGIHGS